jgi:hypothetical protein
MSTVALNNKVLLILKHAADLLIGVYLLIIAVMDTIVYGKDYCHDHLNWLSSVYCIRLGVLSTIGHELSLFSMTSLGLVRAVGIRYGNLIGDRVAKRSILKIVGISFVIILLSTVIATIPLATEFEDFFVNGMTYKPSVKLFIGAPGKSIHLSIIEVYYGNIKTKNLKWRVINDLVDDMFSSDYSIDALGRKNIEFYGNDGVCVFKFFVKADDPQRIYSWAVLTINMICLAVISLCYIYINMSTKASSKILTREITPLAKVIKRRNKKLQRKVSLIIATDFFCWLPVTIASSLHSAGVIDATSYYPVISIVFLPINSVINPILYCDFYTKLMVKFYGKMAGAFAHNLNVDNFPGRRTEKVQMIEMKTLKQA